MAAYRTTTPEQRDAAAPTGLTDEAVRQAVAQAEGNVQVAWDTVMAAYLEGHISLGRAAQLLGLSRFELLDRLHRLGLPVNVGPASLDEATTEFDALRS